jgi:hypothetical protein
VGHTPCGGAVSPFEGGGASCLYEGHTYILNEIWTQDKNTYFGKAWLKYFTYQLLPVLAPNYKQHVLPSAEVRKVCYSVAELYVKSVI